MTISEKLTAVVVCGVLIVVGLSYFGRVPVVPPRPDTVVIRESVLSKAVAETTLRTVTRTRTLRDTVVQRLTDTAFVLRYVLRVDTLLQRCEECGQRLERHRVFADSVIKSRDDTIATLRAQLQTCKARRPWWALGGLAAGVAVCRR